MNSHEILVTGATGGIGRDLVDALAAAGAPVRAMCRRPEQIRAFTDRGIHAVHGDFTDPDSLERAMNGCDRVFLLTFPGREQQTHGHRGIEAARRAGVERVVHLGAADADPRSPVPWAVAPAQTDAELKASGLEWTLLRPSAFMQNLLSSAAPVRRGLLPQASGRGAVGWIDTADIARVAAHVLTTDGHTGADHVLTGPERLSMPQVAAALTGVLGRRVRYLDLPGAVFQAVLRLSGADAWTARGLRAQFADVVRHATHGVDVLTTTVEDLTGTPPNRLEDFLRSHRSSFARTS